MFLPLRHRKRFLSSSVLRAVTTLFLLALSCFTLAVQPASAATAEQAISADSFVDSIGVDTHLGYTGGVYGNYTGIKNALQNLGVRHIRDGMTNNTTINNEYNDLATIGVHSTLVADLNANINLYPPPAGRKVTDFYPGCLHSDQPCYFINDYLNLMKPSLERIEGLNEYDFFSQFYPETAAFRPYPNSPYGNTTWYRVLCDYMQQLHDAVRSDHTWDYLPITAPTFASYNSATYIANTCGDWANKWVDSASLHDYVGVPMVPDIQANINAVGKAFPNTPFVTTETGWDTTAGAAQPISEAVQGKYIPRLLFEQYNQGIHFTSTYELIDEGNDPNNAQLNYGIMHNDFTPKPAYTAEKNLISLLSDPGNPIQPGSLDYAISTDNTSVHHTLLQKRDGTFYLALWQDIKSTDTDVNTPVTLTFNTPVSEADTYDPLQGTTAIAQQSNPSSLTVNVPDKVLLLKITPSTLVPPPAGTNPPQTTPCPTTGCPQEPLPPPPPPSGPLPDLTITHVSYSGTPAVGQPLSFSATVKNIGYAPTPDGITIGVAFSGPGGLLCFEDKYNSSLAPGQSVTLPCNPGFTWTPPAWAAGRATITATVDDVNRIQETNKNNNSKSITLNILSSGTVPTNLQATAGNSAVFLDWGGTTSAQSYNVKRTTILQGATPTPQPPEISGSTAAAPATVDLTSEGTLDWAHWDLGSKTGFDHKAGVTSQISNYSVVQAGYIDAFGGNTPTFSWSDGTPTASNSSQGGIYMGPYVPNAGFSFTVPADTLPRMLKVYGQARNFSATLSDGSAPTYSASTDGTGATVFTVIYNAASAGQTLTVSLTDPQYHNINLESATLSGPLALGPLSTIVTGIKGTFYKDTKVVPGVTYFYSVSAVSASGEGANSNYSAATPLSGTATVTPILECVANNGGGSYTAYFSYQNSGTAVVEIPLSTHNRFYPRTTDPLDEEQPTVFQPGPAQTYPNAAFSVDFNGKPLTWHLDGQHVTASSSSPACPQAKLIGIEQSEPNTVDLTAEGTLDWAHWGYGNGPNFDHKAGVTSQISNYSVVGAGYVSNFPGAPTTFSWSDGTPTASATTATGIYIGPYVANSGFSITVPADTTAKTLRIYLGTYQSQVNFRATLSDGIASDYNDSTLLDRIGASGALYTVTFQASKPGQTLTITITDATNTGNVNLQAATLTTAS